MRGLTSLFVVLACALLLQADNRLSSDDLRELHLNNGSVLRNVVIVSYGAKTFMAKWEGGRGTVAYNQLAEDLQAKLLPLAAKAEPILPRPTPAPRAAVPEKTSLSAPITVGYTLTGQVYITTPTAGAYRFPGAKITVFAASDLGWVLNKQQNNLPGAFHQMRSRDQSEATYQAWLSTVPDIISVTASATDADGNFSVKVPTNEAVVILCTASRVVVREGTDRLIWLCPASVDTGRLDLNDTNRWIQP